ncbi:HFL294Cp [Eremothecium sinecaudum]|uniref:HFL294Cp n=1 Tax=Eremothecium sinecaudum TaxID=45286 RepID=A0A0X8HU46_9SACH|nr:HFL294Cp [Eremothecium sinecaudum]AMD21562.1 HFL294Cp [Eremothecium sinecaudum]
MTGGYKTNNWKRYVFITLPVLFSIVLLLRFISQSKSKDLQKMLQSLPKDLFKQSEVTRTNEEIIDKFELLSEQLLKKQDEQIKRLDRERKMLEKKVSELRQPAEHYTLRERLAARFEYEITAKFPSYIWQTWPFSDLDERMDSELQGFERNWADRNPGFVHEIANDVTASALVHYFYASIPEVIEAYENLPSAILKVDFFKYLILLARGGVYADIDTKPHQPVPNWIPENVAPKETGLIIGIEHDAKNADWKSNYIRRLQFCTWVIQAKPGHPIIREFVARITEETLRRMKTGDLKVNLRNDLNIMGWTGSGAWTDVIFTYLNDYVQSGILTKITWKDFHHISVPKLVGDILVFPQDSFNAPMSLEKSPPEKKALQFVAHKSMKSWKKPPN